MSPEYVYNMFGRKGYSSLKVAMGVIGSAGYSSSKPRKPEYQWKPWFAWRPVTTIGGRKVWWQRIYRSKGNDYVDHDDWTWYYYADEFDLLKDI